MTRPSDILRAARELIAEPQWWKQGDEWFPGKKCAAEAIEHVTGSFVKGAAFDLLEEAAGTTSVTDWNDANDHATVLAGFDAAIALAEREEKP